MVRLPGRSIVTTGKPRVEKLGTVGIMPGTIPGWPTFPDDVHIGPEDEAWESAPAGLFWCSHDQMARDTYAGTAHRNEGAAKALQAKDIPAPDRQLSLYL